MIDFEFKTMDFVSKMIDFEFKTMDFVLKMMILYWKWWILYWKWWFSTHRTKSEDVAGEWNRDRHRLVVHNTLDEVERFDDVSSTCAPELAVSETLLAACKVHDFRYKIHHFQYKNHHFKCTIHRLAYKIQNSKFKIQESMANQRWRPARTGRGSKGSDRCICSGENVHTI